MHLRLGAKLIDFSGYQLPVWYTSLRDEHLAVRSHCGLFDISHMGAIRLTGPYAESLLERITCSSTTKARRGIMTYSMILNQNGGILDDIMMGKVSNDEWILIANASNKHKIIHWISLHNPENVPVSLIETHAMMAIQGPNAASTLGSILGSELKNTPRFSIRPLQFEGQNGYILRSGYTGEDGFELIIPNSSAESLATQLIASGATPCGLAARDSLRIEAGLPLYGHELTETVTPLNTRYPWVINWKGDFIGKPALETQRLTEISPVTVGIRCNTKQIPRQGAVILEGGKITSGTLTPNGSHAIAMAMVPPSLQAIGTPLSVQIRNNVVSAVVVQVPFQP